MDVAAAFVQLMDDVGVGPRFQALTLEAEGPVDRAIVTLDRPARDRLFEIVSATPSARDDSLVGVLVEADFESNTARLRTTGASTSRFASRPSSPKASKKGCGARRSSAENSAMTRRPWRHGRYACDASFAAIS